MGSLKLYLQKRGADRRHRFAPGHDERFNHADTVLAVAEINDGQVDDFVSQSWARSLQHNIDPAAKNAPTILTIGELNTARGPLERLTELASDELDRLFATVRHAGYAVLLCSETGVIVDYRGPREELDRFRFWGSWLGAVWSEQIEGTNGVGTCLVERRPITIHRSQHFRSRHIGLSCSSAPIFDHTDKLIAVLDASSINPNLSEGSHAMAGALAVATAHAIEERLFREAFRSCWIIAAITEAHDAGILLAVDRDFQIVAVGRSARTFMGLRDLSLEQRSSLWTVFERDAALFRVNGQVDRTVTIKLSKGSEELRAFITPPAPAAGKGWQSPDFTSQHTSPRLHLIGRFRRSEPHQHRGGLAQPALKRVRDLVEARIDQQVDLTSMAAAAGLSVHHFARAFKESEGITPHGFVLLRRVERAKLLLLNSEMPLSQVAAASGFADQSHFTRCFRRATGAAPGAFRNGR